MGRYPESVERGFAQWCAAAAPTLGPIPVVVRTVPQALVLVAVLALAHFPMSTTWVYTDGTMNPQTQLEHPVVLVIFADVGMVVLHTD